MWPSSHGRTRSRWSWDQDYTTAQAGKDATGQRKPYLVCGHCASAGVVSWVYDTRAAKCCQKCGEWFPAGTSEQGSERGDGDPPPVAIDLPAMVQQLLLLLAGHDLTSQPELMGMVTNLGERLAKRKSNAAEPPTRRAVHKAATDRWQKAVATVRKVDGSLLAADSHILMCEERLHLARTKRTEA